MEEFALLRDFAIIMVVAGAVALLFRKLRQPPILGYLIAGLIVSPHTLPISPTHMTLIPVRRIYGQLRRTFTQVIFGDE